ncbi:mechanosensitive ion channel family protein [Deinococcus irradiatisoli]|uniref:Mechanosensitive ion channel family protein n=1 Tax=Deinococcus irradiatisoli TaxID=2202254 RepID=A0A2Z3JLH5_9DEIO|nr:mechanosensitive ion channel family protein [Deinococcus irradiatisoli]AWN22114.1 mechanosensitive ion channel family protein [Deinococcus irradiatisoli]
MLDLLIAQLSKPWVWLKIVAVLLIAYAIWWAGNRLLRSLSAHLPATLLKILKGLWLATGIVGAAAVTVYAVYVPVPILFDAGQLITSWFRASAGQLVVIVALALISWNLIGLLSSRIVPGDDFNRRAVRLGTLRGVVESTLRVVIFVIATISVLQAIGINATTLLAGVSVFGLAVGFGAQSLIKDVFNGFFILLEDQYGVGDVISVNGGSLGGGVEKLNLRVTALRALDGTMHIIPNGQIQTVSVSSKDWSRVVATVDVTYAANVNDALRVLQRVSDELYADPEWSGFFLEKPEMQGVTNLAADGVELRALFKVHPKTQYALGREFNRRIKIAMDQAGIEIPYPQRTISMGDTPISIRLVREERGPNLEKQEVKAPGLRPAESRDPEVEDNQT